MPHSCFHKGPPGSCKLGTCRHRRWGRLWHRASWTCNYYTDGKISGKKSMKPGATDGPTCDDGKSLTCSCPADPCENRNAALPSDLKCAGAGDDGDSSSCFKLHHTYGTPHAAQKAMA